MHHERHEQQSCKTVGWRLPPSVAAAAVLAMGSAQAVQIEAGEDWSMRWDNTIKASTKYRLKNADPALNDSFRLLVPGVPASAFPQALNFNAGDQNFQNKGIVSERLDLLTEFDAVYRRNFGLRISAAGWYDHKIRGTTDASDTLTTGQTPYNKFPDETVRTAGRKAEVLDAFVFGGWNIDETRKVTARLGRHALQYGESLFFGDNGIARAQGPIDIDKLLALPGAQFKEIIRPVPQLSAQVQLSPSVSVGGYYQFRWESDRLPASGTYFSTLNFPWGSQQPEFVSAAGGQFMLLPGGDVKPKNSGQFGLQLKARLNETDLGFYYARYHDKGGQAYGRLDVLSAPSPAGMQAGQWHFEFPQDVRTFGASASRTVGSWNLAVEASVRDNMPLRSNNMIYPSVAPKPKFAVGKTAHLNFSWLAQLDATPLYGEATLLGELAWNRVLSRRDPDQQLDGGRTRDATAIRMIFSPTYRQVLPGWDLTVPIGIGYTLDGYSSVTAWGAKKTGDFSLGLEGTYESVWQLGINYTKFIGKAAPFADYSPLLTGGAPVLGNGNNLADRDFISLSLRRTF